MDKANMNQIKTFDLSEFHKQVRNKLFHDKPTSQSDNPATYRKSISLLDTSVLDTTNAEKLIQYMQIKRGYNNRPRLLLNSCSPEKVKRIWPIEVEKLIEGDDKRKENASKRTSKNKSNALENDSTPKSHLTQDFQPIVSVKKLPNDLFSQDQVSKNTPKGHLSFHPVIASTPNQGKTIGSDISIISGVSYCINETSSDTDPESVKQPARVLNEADTNTKRKTNISKVNAESLNKTKNTPKHATFVQDNIPENRTNNIEKENNAQDQELHSNQNCDDDERTLTNNSKTLLNNETNNSKNNKTRNEVSSMLTKRELKSKLRKSKASNLSLRKALIQSRLRILQNSLATSTKKTANEFTQKWISSPVHNNKTNKTLYREISTTNENCNLEANQHIETSEDINSVRNTVDELRKDYGQAPFVVIPIHQTFHPPTAAEHSINNKTSGYKETEVLERSKKQPTKKQPDKSYKSSDKSNRNSSSDLMRLPSLDDLLTDDEEPSPSQQPLDLRVNACNPSVHTEMTTKTKTSNRSSIKNLSPNDILVDDIIYYTQKQRNVEKSCSEKSKTCPAQSRLSERRKSVMIESNASRPVISPVPESIALDESESERIVDDIYPNMEPEWHKNLYQSTKESNEKSLPPKKRRGRRPKKRNVSIITPYLELSKRVNKRKKRTQSFSKRKLYSKGRSDDELSNSGSNSLEDLTSLYVSSTNTLKHAESNQNESKQKSKKESKSKSSYAEKNNEDEPIPKITQHDNDDIFVKPANPVSKLKQNKKTKKKLSKVSKTSGVHDHFDGSQSADVTVSETNQTEQTKEKKISEQSKNIKKKNNNSAIVKNNIEIPLESISVEPELQDWVENDVKTSTNSADNNEELKQRRSSRLKSNLKENSVRTDLVNHNTNIDVVNSSSNIRSQQTLIEKKSSNHNEEYSEQNEKKQQNTAKKTNKAKEKQSKAKGKNEQKKLNRNNNRENEALLEDDSAQNGLRRSKRTHRPPIQYWTNSGQAQEIIDLESEEVKKLIKSKSKKYVQKKKNAQSQQSKGIEKKQDDCNEQTVCDLFDQLKENLEDTLRKRKESPRISDISNKKRLKLTENNKIDTEIRKLSCEVMPPPPVPPPPRNKTIKPAKTNSTLNSTERSLPSYIRSNANAAASSDDGIGTDENNGMSTLVAESVNTVYSSQKRQEKDGTKDFLLDWLMYSSPPYLQQNRDIFKLLSSDKIKIACIENLVINEVNGVEYANYTGKDNNYGYMKFYPNSQKPRSKTKNKEMKLLILFGSLQIILDEKCFNVKNGDFVTIPQGTRYIINNKSDQCAILFFIKP